MAARLRAVPSGGSFDPERFRLEPGAPGDATIPARKVETGIPDGRRAAREHAFIRGPIPLRVIEALRKADKGGSAWAVAFALRYKADVTRQAWVKPPATLLERWGVDKDARARALAALERAGRIEVRRRRGRPPLVRVPPWEGWAGG